MLTTAYWAHPTLMWFETKYQLNICVSCHYSWLFTIAFFSHHNMLLLLILVIFLLVQLPNEKFIFPPHSLACYWIRWNHHVIHIGVIEMKKYRCIYVMKIGVCSNWIRAKWFKITTVSFITYALWRHLVNINESD